MIQTDSEKRKAAVIVINSCLSSTANCVNFFSTCNEMKVINGKCQNTFACVEELLSVLRSFFCAMLSITNKFA